MRTLIQSQKSARVGGAWKGVSVTCEYNGCSYTGMVGDITKDPRVWSNLHLPSA